MSETEIKSKIETLKEEIKDVHGTPCQVYSRVVGYLRPVQSYNIGKVEEFRVRKYYNAGNGEQAKELANAAHASTMSEMKSIKCFRQCK